MKVLYLRFGSFIHKVNRNNISEMIKTFRILGGILPVVIMAAGFAACGGEPEDEGFLYLSVSPSKVLYNPLNTSQNVIDINSGSPWTVSVSDPGLKLSRTSGGSGRQSISVTAMDEGRTYTATFRTTRTDPGGNPILRVVDISTGAFEWAELPETEKESDDYKYIVHYSKTIKTKKDVRNYSACYDTRRHNPMYVAFPYHTIYYEGGFARTTPDPWRPDPGMTEAEQSVIYRTDWNDWPWDGDGYAPYSTWGRYPFSGSGSSVSFVRGHMMRSAERGGAGSELNVQTFYPTNIAPERLKYETHWTAVEGIMPTDWVCRDTVYVVVGCHYANDNYTTYDAASGSSSSARSKKVIIPTARYKLFLRTKLGNTGKSIAQCNANEVMAIGFWFEQNFGPDIPDSQDPPLKTVIYSVEDIEEMTGNIFNFFPQAPGGVKNSYNINDWPGLPAIANK